MLASFELPLMCRYFPPSRLLRYRIEALPDILQGTLSIGYELARICFIRKSVGIVAIPRNSVGSEDLDVDTFECVI